MPVTMTPDRKLSDQPQLKLTNGARRAVRLRYLSANVFELSFAAFAVIAAVNYLVHPSSLESGSFGSITFPDLVWNMLYLLGAVMIVSGLARLHPRSEVVGLCLFAAALLIQAVAIIHYRGVQTPAASLAALVAFAAASIVRIYLLMTAVNRTTILSVNSSDTDADGSN